MGGSAHLPLQNTICHTRLGVFPGILCSNALTPKKKTLADSSGLHGHPHRGTQFNIHIDLKSKSKSEKKARVGKMAQWIKELSRSLGISLFDLRAHTVKEG